MFCKLINKCFDRRIRERNFSHLAVFFSNTRPAAFDMHSRSMFHERCKVSYLWQSCKRLRIALLLFLQMKIGESSFLQFLIFSDSVSCFEKRVKAYLYGQGVLSEDDAENDLVTLRDC